jgi:chemotaxis protein MotA
MLVIIGWLVVAAAVAGGYAAAGGHLAVLFQPYEFVIIFGAGLGAIVCSSGKATLKGLGGGFMRAVKGPKYKKADYLELLCLLYQIFRLAKSKGNLGLEQHIENPQDSALFQQFPKFYGDHHTVEFTCDYLRLMILGADNPHEVEALMDLELETHHQEEGAVGNALQSMADALPALGIVAAVLGVIHTMGLMSEPPEVLGHAIGAALVGTFSGILMAYGFVGPLAGAYNSAIREDEKYYECLKAGILAHMSGSPPAVAIEFARKTLLSHTRPTFFEVENAASELPAPA